MKSPGYRITAQAVSDLSQIWKYTAYKWSSEQADRYYELIINEFLYISKNLNAGKPAEHIRKGYRSLAVKSHLIYYRIADDQIPEIIRILHQRMDVDNDLAR